MKNTHIILLNILGLSCFFNSSMQAAEKNKDVFLAMYKSAAANGNDLRAIATKAGREKIDKLNDNEKKLIKKQKQIADTAMKLGGFTVKDTYTVVLKESEEAAVDLYKVAFAVKSADYDKQVGIDAVTISGGAESERVKNAVNAMNKKTDPAAKLEVLITQTKLGQETLDEVKKGSAENKKTAKTNVIKALDLAFA